MADDNFQQRVNAVEQDGETRFGKEGWRAALGAVSRHIKGGIPQNEMETIMAAQPDTAGFLFNAGRHQLMNEASDGDRDAERQFNEIRSREREAYRKSKGR